MRVLYFDCSMGAAGDMLTASLLEIVPDPDKFIEKLNNLGLPNIKFEKELSTKCGINGTHISVKINGDEEGEHHHHHHHHSSLHDIEHIVNGLTICEDVKSDILSVYNLIAEAESHAHGVPVEQIHFHEVGAMDAIADVTAVCLLMSEISADEVYSSPIHVGSGTVKCAHGILPVPAPATAYILRDVPVYSGEIRSELCTPTGAALLKHFVTSFGDMPVMKVQKIGYGMGKKEFEVANCVRTFFGDAEDKSDIILELSCNVDDMTAEEIGFAEEMLFEAGANEVYTIGIGMKKSRPGTLIRVMCNENLREKIIETIYKYTTTIGVRETVTKRYILNRKVEKVATPFGEVRQKISTGYGCEKKKYEYDDLAKIAKENNLSLDEVKKKIEN